MLEMYVSLLFYFYLLILSFIFKNDYIYIYIFMRLFIFIYIYSHIYLRFIYLFVYLFIFYFSVHNMEMRETVHCGAPVHHCILSRMGIFVTIAKNTLYGSKLSIFLCQK